MPPQLFWHFLDDPYGMKIFGTKQDGNWKIVPNNPLTSAADIADLDNELMLIIELQQ